VKALLDRPIEGDWPYLWIDATYVKVRQAGRIVSVAVIAPLACPVLNRRIGACGGRRPNQNVPRSRSLSVTEGALRSAFEYFLEVAKFERMARDTKDDNERDKLIATARHWLSTARHRRTLEQRANVENSPTNA
jgi:mutator family transposase